MSQSCRTTRQTTRNTDNPVEVTSFTKIRLEADSGSSDTDRSDRENVSNNLMNTRKSTKKAVATKLLATPKSKRRGVQRSDDDEPNLVSPPKQGKLSKRTESETLGPVNLLDKLSLTSPKAGRNYQNKYQNARKTLNSAETYNLPGREKELAQLSEFLANGLTHGKSSSMYISGPPGTGKTACLSKLLNASEFTNKFKCVYVNCTSIASIGSIYKKICTELNLKGGTEKESLASIEQHLSRKHKTILMVLDEIDQLIGKKQSVLYTIFEWPALPNSNILLIGIANSLDLTDRMLSRLHIKCELKPKLMHFSPYTKQQIIDIFKARLEEADVLDIFPPVTIQLLAAKVASISGDVRRALDIGRRVIEMAEEQKRGLQPFDMSRLGIGDVTKQSSVTASEKVEIKQVMSVLNQVYGASQQLDDEDDTFPLQQKILICTILLILKHDKNKDITVGRLHAVYSKVCNGRNISALGQSEFSGLCELVETRGILKIIKNKEPRLCKVQLQWNEDEVTATLQDKQLIANILNDTGCIKK